MQLSWKFALLLCLWQLVNNKNHKPTAKMKVTGELAKSNDQLTSSNAIKVLLSIRPAWCFHQCDRETNGQANVRKISLKSWRCDCFAVSVGLNLPQARENQNKEIVYIIDREFEKITILPRKRRIVNNSILSQQTGYLLLCLDWALCPFSRQLSVRKTNLINKDFWGFSLSIRTKISIPQSKTQC